MAHKYETTRKFESKTFEGVTFYLKKLTEGRRMEIRAKQSGANAKINILLKEMATIEKQDEAVRDVEKYMLLQEEFTTVVIEEVNPSWILWGTKSIEGLEADGKPLTVEDWKEWPSDFFEEVLGTIKAESEMSGAERKNLQLGTTSGELVAGTPRSLTVVPAKEKVSGEDETVLSTSQTM